MSQTPVLKENNITILFNLYNIVILYNYVR
jgi:hypothetical protein